MVALNREFLIDLACVPEITVAEVAERLGISTSTVEKFYNRNRIELMAARHDTTIPDRLHAEVLALWGDNYSHEEIAARTGLGGAVVRRLILAAEIEEQPEDQGASLELLALQLAHPGRMYMDDVRALTEYGGGRRLGAPDAGLRSAA
jgi:DNA-binding CsgD family transcriptional regulator